jgi:signal peptidase I
MFSTIIFTLVFLGLLTITAGLWAVLLRLGVRWAKIKNATTNRIILATVAVIVLQTLLALLYRLVSASSKPDIAIAIFAAEVLTPPLVIAMAFKARPLRAFQAWLPTIITPIAIIPFIVFVLRPFLFETFAISTNGMAPTLIGNHSRGVCEKCGQTAYGAVTNPRSRRSEPQLMICDDFHVSQYTDNEDQVFSPDRIIVSKFLKPRRWDLVVFQNPADPSILFVMRLIGLPGEEIRIKDGAAWANDRRLEPPESLQGIEYLSRLPHWNNTLWGSNSSPAVLGDTEYFMLGDFSARSFDSRAWQQGAPGHNPFAVPSSHIQGVATHIYWPPQHWRILR